MTPISSNIVFGRQDLHDTQFFFPVVLFPRLPRPSSGPSHFDVFVVVYFILLFLHLMSAFPSISDPIRASHFASNLCLFIYSFLLLPFSFPVMCSTSGISCEHERLFDITAAHGHKRQPGVRG